MRTDSAARLRERGIQVTAQRLAVWRVVAAQPHVTADAVAEAVRLEIGAISLQAVYDALGLLASEGLIRRIQPSGSPALYEDRVGDNHHHLICRICGRVVDVDCAVGAAPCLAPADDRGFEIDEAEVAYWGRCPDCLDQSRSAVSSDRPATDRMSAERASTERASAERTVAGRASAGRPTARTSGTRTTTAVPITGARQTPPARVPTPPSTDDQRISQSHNRRARRSRSRG